MYFKIDLMLKCIRFLDLKKTSEVLYTAEVFNNSTQEQQFYNYE